MYSHLLFYKNPLNHNPRGIAVPLLPPLPTEAVVLEIKPPRPNPLVENKVKMIDYLKLDTPNMREMTLLSI